MQTLEFTATPQDAGQRMDRWLSDCCSELSRSALQALMEQGMVLRQGGPVNKKEKVAAGDTVQITLPDPYEPTKVTVLLKIPDRCQDCTGHPRVSRQESILPGFHLSLSLR